MGISDRRKVFKSGAFSNAITLPAKLRIGTYVTLAANRLVLIDPRGLIPANSLSEILEKEIEPNLNKWLLEVAPTS